MSIYKKNYTPDIELLIEKEIETQREEDRHDERFFNDRTRELKNGYSKYREWAIDSLMGNGLIK